MRLYLSRSKVSPQRLPPCLPLLCEIDSIHMYMPGDIYVLFVEIAERHDKTVDIYMYVYYTKAPMQPWNQLLLFSRMYKLDSMTQEPPAQSNNVVHVKRLVQSGSWNICFCEFHRPWFRSRAGLLSVVIGSISIGATLTRQNFRMGQAITALLSPRCFPTSVLFLYIRFIRINSTTGLPA